MLDRHEAHEKGQELPHRDAADRAVTNRPAADREVPLPGTAAAEGSALVIQQWLDGEVSETEARRADAKQVDMWNRVHLDTAARRRMVTPSHVMANVMAAIPDAPFEKQVAMAAVIDTMVSTPAGRVSRSAALVIGAGLFAAGIVLGKLL